MSHFNKQVGKFIDKTKAGKLKHNWKKTGIITESSFIGSDILFKILNTPGAVGIRVVYGLDNENNMQPIIYPCDSNGSIIRASQQASTLQAEDDSDGADASVPCPPYCAR